MGLTRPELIGGEGSVSYPWHRCHSVSLLPCPACPLVQFPEGPTVSAHSFRRCHCVGRRTSLALWLWCQRCRGALSPSSLPSAGVQEAEVPVWRDGAEPALRRAQDHPGKGDRGTEGPAGGREATRSGRLCRRRAGLKPTLERPGARDRNRSAVIFIKATCPYCQRKCAPERSDGKHKHGTSAPGNRLRGEPSEDGAGCRSPRLLADGQ